MSKTKNNSKKQASTSYFKKAVGKCWQWYKSLFISSPWYIKILSTVISLIVAFILYLGAVDINFLWLFGKSPDMETIKNPITNQATERYTVPTAL